MGVAGWRVDNVHAGQGGWSGRSALLACTCNVALTRVDARWGPRVLLESVVVRMHTYALRSLHVGGLELGWEVAQVELQSARASGHDASETEQLTTVFLTAAADG